MFAATPRLRDRLDVRTVVVVGAIALAAFATQLGVLAGTVAGPLDEAIANLERTPEVTLPAGQALADADRPGEADPRLFGAQLAATHAAAGWAVTTAAGDRRLVPEVCLVYR